jgi:hypothetical protein
LFNDCMIFHLLTAFPINAAEQEKYYITNVLKKPHHVNVYQFVHRLEQLNTYIAQMLCFYYSHNANTSTKPKNVPFTEAELGSPVLHMCPIQWQDQYNMNKKGMTPKDMHLLLTLLEVIERVCTHEKARSEFLEKAYLKGDNGKNILVLSLLPGFLRKSTSGSIATCAKSMGAHLPRRTLVICVGLRKTERRNPNSMPLRKAVRKQILLTRTLHS